MKEYVEMMLPIANDASQTIAVILTCVIINHKKKGAIIMEDTKIQWHPGFVAAMDMEFKEDREKLDFESEHNLNTKPLKIIAKWY